MGNRISVALDADNLLWLKSQAITSGNRSLSETLNAILTRLRTDFVEEPEAQPSFEVTARINESDPDLRTADAAVRQLFARSLDRTAKLFESSREELP